MIGFMPSQGKAADLGGVPSFAAQSARGIGFNFVPRDGEFGHLTHSFGVVCRPIFIFAEQANAFLADLGQIARPPVVSYRL